MALMPNLSGKLRVIYFVLGVAIAAWGLLGSDIPWIRITALSFGSLLVVFGIIAFCPFLWMFGVRGSSS
jgi:DUF2892 family protein